MYSTDYTICLSTLLCSCFSFLFSRFYVLPKSLNSPLTLHSSEKGHTLDSATLGRTWIPLERVSEAFRAKANMGACHLPSVLLLLLALVLLVAFSPPHLLSSCSRRIPKTCDLSLPESASAKVRSCSAAAGAAITARERACHTAGRSAVFTSLTVVDILKRRRES